MKNINLFILFAFVSLSIFAQQDVEMKQIKGVVLTRIYTNDADNAIPGVVIKNEKGKTVAKTNTNGQFTFNYPISLRGDKPEFTFIKKEFKNKKWKFESKKPLKFYLDGETDKYLRETQLKINDEQGRPISGVSIKHSYYQNEVKTNYYGIYVLRAPNPNFMDTWQKDAEDIVLKISKKGYVSQEYHTSYSKLLDPISIKLKKIGADILQTIELVFTNSQNKKEKHKFVNLESLKDYAIKIRSKYPSLSKLILKKIDQNPSLLIFDMVEEQKNLLSLNIKESNGSIKKYKFINLKSIEEFALNLKNTNPQLSKKILKMINDNPDFRNFEILNESEQMIAIKDEGEADENINEGLSGDTVNLSEYISYLESELKDNNVSFTGNNAGQQKTVHRQLKEKVVELKDEVVETTIKLEKVEKKVTYLSWIILAIILFLIPTIISFILFRNNKKTQELNVVLDDKNKKLTLAYTNIQSSILYAERIQRSVLVNPVGIKSSFKNAFVFHRPKDVVSGDFYWYATLGDKMIIAAVDCTGHGVPGAFMTMIGNAFLNEIVNVHKITDPAKILSLLHDKIQNSLMNGETKSNDGMDIAMVCVDSKEKKIIYAGANNPLYYISKNELCQLKADRNGIGGDASSGPIEFKNNVISIEDITSFYLFSDGFYDQFGGLENKKYMKKRFREMLKGIAGKSFSQQEAYLDSELKKWKGDEEQTDDILVIGVEV